MHSPTLESGQRPEHLNHPTTEGVAYSVGMEAVKASRLLERVEGQEQRIRGLRRVRNIGRHVLRRQVNQVREEIATAHQDDPELTQAALGTSEMPQWLKKSVGVTSERPNLGERINKRNFLGRYVVRQSALLNYLDWHHQDMEARQVRFERERLPDLKERFVQAVRGANWLPESARSHLARIGRTRVVLDDGLFTSAGGASGLTRTDGRGNYTMWLSAIKPAAQSGDFFDDYSHEMVHVLTGRDGESDSKRDSGLYRLFGREAAEGIDEEVTEQVSHGLQGGEIDHIDPAYETLDTLCNRGLKPIDVRLFINAYLEDGTERDRLGKQSADARLRSALAEAFPKEEPRVLAARLRSQYRQQRHPDTPVPVPAISGERGKRVREVKAREDRPRPTRLSRRERRAQRFKGSPDDQFHY